MSGDLSQRIGSNLSRNSYAKRGTAHKTPKAADAVDEITPMINKKSKISNIILEAKGIYYRNGYEINFMNEKKD